MSGSIVLELPMPGSVTNASGRRTRHWRTVYNERKAYLASLDALQATGAIPPPPPTPFARATVRSTMYLGGAMDDDNAIARHKAPIDWLHSRGYIASDRRTCLRWEALPEQVVSRKHTYRVVLTLTPISP